MLGLRPGVELVEEVEHDRLVRFVGRVLDRKDDWLLVTTDPRRIGWLRRNQVLLASTVSVK